jgi:hypothetical protein
LFELKPVRNFDWQAADDDRAVVLVPKFRSRLLRRLLPGAAGRNFRVRLDADGSFVWSLCDGGTTVLDIADRFHARSGGDLADVRDRVAGFVQRLARDRLVTLEPQGERS